MSNASAGASFDRERLSALADGELESSAVAATCAGWKQDEAMRATWYSYQLIGDVLRSDELASRPTHDSAFIAALRARLAAEPVVLAPAPVMVAAGGARPVLRRGRWVASSAIAAGFVAVAGVLLTTRAPPPATPAAPQIAATPLPRVDRVAEAAPLPSTPAVPRADWRVVRDPQLDRYLAAHKQFAGSSVLGMPSGLLRNASVEAPAR